MIPKKSNPREYWLGTDTDTQPTQKHKTQETQQSSEPTNSETLETQETQETQGIGFVEVKSARDAVDISLAGEISPGEKLWNFCGALKSFELVRGHKLTVEELSEHFFTWWNAACEKAVLNREAEPFENMMEDFLVQFSKRKTPLGSSTINEAMRRAADESDNPKCSGLYSEAANRKLLRLLMHLQDMAGDQPFSLSVRHAAAFAGMDKTTASKRLLALTLRGYLRLIRKGTEQKDRKTGKRLASEYRFIDSSR